MTVTNAEFGGVRACNAEQVIAAFGAQFELTGAVILHAHALGLLAADWLAEHVLQAPALAEYKRVQAQAWAEYERVQAPALAEYERVQAQALAHIFDRQVTGAL